MDEGIAASTSAQVLGVPGAAPDAPASEAPAISVAQPDAAVEAMDASFWDATANPGRYSFDQPPPGIERSPEQELQVRQLFADEQVPSEVGRHITTLWNRALLNPPSREANVAAMQQLHADITRHDPERGAETIRLAQAEVQAIAKRNPGVLDMLEQSGLGNDRWLVEHLANRARARINRGR